MKLISVSDFALIRSTINDVQDTFYGQAVLYKKARSIGANRFMKDTEETRTYDIYGFFGLIVWKDDTKSIKQEIIGTADMSDAYCLLRFDDVKTAGLIDNNNNFVGLAAEDKFFYNNIQYYMEKVITLGQLDDKDCLVKIFFNKEMKPNK